MLGAGEGLESGIVEPASRIVTHVSDWLDDYVRESADIDYILRVTAQALVGNNIDFPSSPP